MDQNPKDKYPLITDMVLLPILTLVQMVMHIQDLEVKDILVTTQVLTATLILHRILILTVTIIKLQPLQASQIRKVYRDKKNLSTSMIAILTTKYIDRFDVQDIIAHPLNPRR